VCAPASVSSSPDSDPGPGEAIGGRGGGTGRASMFVSGYYNNSEGDIQAAGTGGAERSVLGTGGGAGRSIAC
jgi:hypothetical protein